MKKYLTIILSLFIAFSAFAKRTEPNPVPPLIIGNIKIVVPNDNGFRGYVEVRDKTSDEKLWDKTIYKVWKKPFKESDVQWIFIKSISEQDGKIIIEDEKNRNYSLDPKTKKVKKLKQ
jgi:hypothetical protein